MSPKDAAYATREWIKPKMALPMHYGTNPFLKGMPAEYEAALGQPQVEYHRYEARRHQVVLGVVA